MDNCIFCKITKKEIPATIIYEDNEFIAIFDKFPATLGHVLLLPKTHVETIFEIPWDLSGKLFALATRIAQNMEKKLGIKAVNILQNNGELAGQTVNHFHVHILPRYENDGVIIKSEVNVFSEEKISELKKILSMSE